MDDDPNVQIEEVYWVVEDMFEQEVKGKAIDERLTGWTKHGHETQCHDKTCAPELLFKVSTLR